MRRCTRTSAITPAGPRRRSRPARGRLAQALAVPARTPDTAIAIDHLRLQVTAGPPPPAQPCAGRSKGLEVASQRTVAIKITGACTLSREAYPFKDSWD